MHTLHTFLEKVYMMKVRESKRNKKSFVVQKIFSFLESHPTATVSPGVCRYAGMHGGKKGENKHIFHTIPRHVFFTHFSRKNLHPR